MSALLLAGVMATFAFSIIYLGFETFDGHAAQESRMMKQRIEDLYQRRSSIEKKRNFSGILQLNQALNRQPLSRKLFVLIGLTGWNMPVSIFILLDCLWASLFFLLGGIFQWPVPFLIPATLMAAFLPYWLLVLNKRRYVNKFTSGFPDALMLIRSALRAGQGIQSAFQMVAREGPQPVAREFAQVVREIELGNSVDEALGVMYKRIGSVDLRIFILGIHIQSEVGGNLVELMSHVEHTIRERIAMYREVRTLSAQGKMTGLVLMLLPVGLALILLALNPSYFDPLLESETGHRILVAAGLLQGVGAFVIRKITNFRVHG